MSDPFANLPRGQVPHNRTHGRSRTRAYEIWKSMRARCENLRHPGFKNYGGRGIAVCRRWRKFENFLADMGEPAAGLTLDRFPNKDGHYQPGNCRWANLTEQHRNKRNNLVIDGLCLAAWMERATVSRRTVSRRLAAGWPIERAISETDGRLK